ncbi:MAG: hypothetical protein M3542_01970 [Acidobacteriota bacterium]|nr:hypothetical protein [Acidobacteriota bacterium]MDQ5873236.1 hypothetical protein [Acidobacteriota bacterium]
MSTRKLVLAIGLVGVLGSASTARAQWVRLQRCNGAIPCMIPFAVRYNPDPLIAGQYGYMSPNSMSGRITFEPEGPAVHLDKPLAKLQLPDFASEASRRIQLMRSAPPEKETVPLRVEPAPKPAAPPD